MKQYLAVPLTYRAYSQGSRHANRGAVTTTLRKWIKVRMMHRNSGPDILGEYTHIFLDLYIQGKS